jgi:Na+/H+ antiporter NhaC
MWIDEDDCDALGFGLICAGIVVCVLALVLDIGIACLFSWLVCLCFGMSWSWGYGIATFLIFMAARYAMGRGRNE